MLPLSKRIQFPSICLLLAGGMTLQAQVTTGTLAGAVKDPKGRPVAGATVTITSPALFNPRVVRTDERGDWRAPLLSPGAYTVSAAASGYIGARAEGLRVGLGSQTWQDLQVKPVATAGAVVEVVEAASGGIDKADSKTSTNYSSESLTSLPVENRSFDGAWAMTAGVVAGADGQPSIRGGSINSTLYRINGVDVKNDYQGGRTGTGVLEDMVEDVQVVLSPLNARYGRTTAGSINVVTKQGGNTFGGSIRTSINREAWRASQHSEDAASLASISDDLQKEYTITLLGPVIKDRLWFSFGTRLQPGGSGTYQVPVFSSKAGYNRAFLTGNKAVDAATLAGPSGFAFTTFDTGKYFVRTTDTHYYEGKLSLALAPDHTLEASGMSERQAYNNRDSSSYGSLMILGKQITQRAAMGLSYRGIFGGSAFLEARFNQHQSEDDWPHTINPLVQDPLYVTVLDSKSSSLLPFTAAHAPTGKELRGNRSGAMNLKLLWEKAGSHDTDLGVEYYVGRHRTSAQQGPLNRRFYVGGAYVNPTGDDWRFPAIQWTSATALKQTSSGGIGLAPVMRQYSGQDGETQSPTYSAYVNDAWTLSSRFNVMVGLRADSVRIKDTDGTQVAKTTSLSPRFLVRFDPAGNTSNVFSLSVARFTDDFITGFTKIFTHSADEAYSAVGWTGAALGQPLPGAGSDATAGVRFISYSDLNNPANWKNAAGQYNTFRLSSSMSYVVDPNLQAPSVDELSAGLVHQWEGNVGRTSITYTRRRWHKLWAMGQNYRPDQWKILSDPLGSNTRLAIQTTRVFNSDELARRYDGVEIELQRKLGSSWSLQGNITFSSLTGNNQGGDQSSSTNYDTSLTGYYYQRDFLLASGVPEQGFAPDGYLLSHQLVKAKVSLLGRTALTPAGGFVTYAWLLNYGTGGRFSAADTSPLNLTTYAPISTGVTNPVAPQTYTHYYSSRGAYGTNDRYSVDFKLAFEIPLVGRRVKLVGDIFVNNLFNHMAQEDWDRDFLGDSKGTTSLQAYAPGIFGTTNPGTQYEKDYYSSPRSVTATLGLKF